MAEDITIPEGFEPIAEDESISIPEGFEPFEGELSPVEKAVDLGGQATNLGLSYLRGRTLGLAEKPMAALGAGMAKIPLEALELGQKATNTLGITNKDFEAPSYGELYNIGVRGVQDRVSQSQEENPILSTIAELGGGLRTGVQIGKTKAGKAVSDWVKSPNPIGRPLSDRAKNVFLKTAKQAGLGGSGYAAYKQGVIDPDQQGEGIVSDLVTGGSVSGGLGGVGSAVGYGLNKATPAISEGLEGVVNLAKKHNIPLSLDQVTDSKALKNIQRVSQEMPFSGQEAFRDNQLKAVNRAVIKTFGEDADSFSPALMDKAFTRLGKEFDNFAGDKNFTGESLTRNVTDFLEGAEEAYSKEAFDAATKRIKAIASDFTKDGTISGKKLSFHRQKLNQLSRKANDFDKQSIFRDLENALVETVSEGDEALKAGFQKTKNQYKNLLAVEPLTAKSKGGNISLPQLNTRVGKIYGRQHVRGKSGDLGEVARVGNELLGELGGPDTAQKLLYTGAAGATAATGFGLGSATVPLAVGGSLAANKGFQKWFNQNPNVVENALLKLYKEQGKEGAKKIGMTAKELIEGN